MIWAIFIGLMAYESLIWSWTIYRHAKWLYNHPEDADSNPLIGHMRLRYISITSGLLSFLSIVGWVVMMAQETHAESVPSHEIMFSLSVLFIQLTNINLFAVIARYSCLPRSMWPLLSTWVSMFIVKYLGVKEPPLSSMDVYECRYKKRKGDVPCGKE